MTGTEHLLYLEHESASAELTATLRRVERRRRARLRVATVVGACALASTLVAAAGVSIAMGIRVAPEPKRTAKVPVRPEPPAPPPAPQEVPASAEASPSEPSVTATPAPVPQPQQPAAVEAAKPTTPRKARGPRRASVAARPTQHFAIKIGPAGYEPSTVHATAGTPIRLTVGKGEGCAAGFLMPSLGIHADNSAGSADMRIRPLKVGRYTFSCGMGMVTGTLVVR